MSQISHPSEAGHQIGCFICVRRLQVCKLFFLKLQEALGPFQKESCEQNVTLFSRHVLFPTEKSQK